MKQTNLLVVGLLGILILAGCSSTSTEADSSSPGEPTSTTVDAALDEEQTAQVETDVTADQETQTQVGDDAGTEIEVVSEPDSADFVTLKGEVWADNWFAFYLGEELIKEDSVPITTERSFNAETFTFDASYPLVFNFIAKDFKENDTGLEYIGSNRQQMGDGGLIAQFIDTTTGELVAATDSNWACTVIHEAPLSKSCEQESNPVAGQAPCDFLASEEPADWKTASFNDSAWSNAVVYSESDVSPKDGYDQISWDAAAELIWGYDLETSNTILCRLTIPAPQ